MTAQGKPLQIFVSKTELEAQGYQVSNPAAMCFSSDAESLVFDGRTHNFLTAEERAYLNAQLSAANQAAANSKLAISITTKVGGVTVSSSTVYEVGTMAPTYDVAVTYGGRATEPTSVSASGSTSVISSSGRAGLYTAFATQAPIGRVTLTVTATYEAPEYSGITATKTTTSAAVTYVAPIYIIESATRITADLTAAESTALIASDKVIAKHVVTSASAIGKININCANTARYIYALFPTTSTYGPQITDVTVSDNSIIKETVVLKSRITNGSAQMYYTAIRLTELTANTGEVISGATFK